MSRLGFALCAILTLGGCAHSSLVLLPDEDGGHGAVAVLSPDGGETVVSEANSRTTLGGAKPTVRPLGAKGLNPREAALLNGLPPPPKSFMLYFLEGTTEMTATTYGMSSRCRSRLM